MTRCSICGGTSFTVGYAGRTAPNGSLPTCAVCNSTERHRIVHGMYQALAPLTQRCRALQFAPDGSLLPSNFGVLDTSTYGGKNSLDVMRTGLAAGSYDLIASNHVLEHVQDPLLAIREMLRVVGPRGIVHICVPSPTQVAQTRDWGYADPARTYHYRVYGADAGPLFLRADESLHITCGVGRDQVTDTYEMVYWLSLDAQRLTDWTVLLQRAQFAVVVVR